MRSYDEITSQVLEKAAVKAVRIKRIRYTCTLSVVCAACAIGGSAFMKLEKPEIQPDYPSESQADSFHSASDPSTDVTEETTEAVTETTVATTTVSETTATLVAVDEITTTVATVPADIVTIYVEPGSAPITTSIPGETHTAATTTKHTATSHRTESAETTVTTVAATDAAAETILSETDLPTETEPIPVDTAAPVTEPVVEIPSDIPTEPETTEPATDVVPEETNWQLLYELYLSGDLPFSIEILEDLKALEELMPAQEPTEAAVSLFPDFTT